MDLWLPRSRGSVDTQVSSSFDSRSVDTQVSSSVPSRLVDAQVSSESVERVIASFPCPICQKEYATRRSTLKFILLIYLFLFLTVVVLFSLCRFYKSFHEVGVS